MIKHYLEVHEYINKHIYRLPVSEYQIITEGFGWGMLAGLGIAGLIAIAWKLIDNYMQEHGWGDSGSSSSSKDDDKGKFNLERVKSYLADGIEYLPGNKDKFISIKNIYEYIKNSKDGITDEDTFNIFYNNLSKFNELQMFYIKTMSIIIAYINPRINNYDNTLINKNPIKNESVIFKENSNAIGNLFTNIVKASIDVCSKALTQNTESVIKAEANNKDIFDNINLYWIFGINISEILTSYNQYIECFIKHLNDLASKNMLIDAGNRNWTIDELKNQKYDELKKNIDNKDWLINTNSDNKYTIFKEFWLNMNEIPLQLDWYINKIKFYAYMKENEIDKNLEDLIKNVNETNRKDVIREILTAVYQDATGIYVNAIIKSIKERKNEGTLYIDKEAADKDSNFTTAIDGLKNAIKNKKPFNELEQFERALFNVTINSFTEDHLKQFANVIVEYWKYRESLNKPQEKESK